MKNIAVIGATGIVGEKLIEILDKEGKNYNVSLFATKKSEGRQYALCGQTLKVEELNDTSAQKNDFDLAYFCAENAVSAKYLPMFTARGTVCVDNSSFFRLASAVPLIIPEINRYMLFSHNNIIANPNCTSVIVCLALNALNLRFGIKRVVASTYQAVSGGGKEAVDDYLKKRGEGKTKKPPHKIYDNCIPHIDDFCPNGYTKEEMKVAEECAKILCMPASAFTCTAVRVPLLNCHSVSLNVELASAASTEEITSLLCMTEGVEVMDDRKSYYPMPLLLDGKRKIGVGRIRRDGSRKNTFNLWATGDNLLKGAAYNAYQIGEIVLGG